MTQPAFDTATGQAIANSAASGYTLTAVIANNPNRFLYFGFPHSNSNPITGITYAGQSLEPIGSYSVSTTGALSTFGLINPPAGTGTLVLVLTNTTSWSATPILASFYNVDQTTPYGTLTAVVTTSPTHTLNISSSANDLVLVGIACYNSGPQLASVTAIGTTELAGFRITAGRLHEIYAGNPTDANFSVSCAVAFGGINNVYHGLTLHNDASASVSAPPAVSLSAPTGTVQPIPPHLLFVKPGMSAERRWWLDELRRRYEARLHADMALAPDFEAEIEAALAALMPTELPAPIAPDTPVGALDTAVAALELAALQDARARAERRTRLAAQHAALARLTPQIDALNARIATLETQADDDRVLLFALPYTIL